MSYTPTEWKSGDIVTSEKLNKLEQGVASSGTGGILFATIDMDMDTHTMTFDKTWKQIHDASFVAASATAVEGDPPYSKLFTFVIDAFILSESVGELIYYVRTFNSDNVETPLTFTTDSEDGYPVLQSN
jgi:hypothetical protein